MYSQYIDIYIYREYIAINGNSMRMLEGIYSHYIGNIWEYHIRMYMPLYGHDKELYRHNGLIDYHFSMGVI